jgi:hypothetical protein
MPNHNIKKVIKHIEEINRRREDIQAIMQHGTMEQKCFIQQMIEKKSCQPHSLNAFDTLLDTSESSHSSQQKIIQSIDQLRNTNTSDMDNPSYQKLYKILESHTEYIYGIEFDFKIKNIFESLIHFCKQHFGKIETNLYNIDKEFYLKFLDKILSTSTDSKKIHLYYIKAIQCFILCMIYPEECFSDPKHISFFKKISNLVFFSRIFSRIIEILLQNINLKKSKLSSSYFPKNNSSELHSILTKLI